MCTLKITFVDRYQYLTAPMRKDIFKDEICKILLQISIKR